VVPHFDVLYHLVGYTGKNTQLLTDRCSQTFPPHKRACSLHACHFKILHSTSTQYELTSHQLLQLVASVASAPGRLWPHMPQPCAISGMPALLRTAACVRRPLIICGRYLYSSLASRHVVFTNTFTWACVVLRRSPTQRFYRLYVCKVCVIFRVCTLLCYSSLTFVYAP